MAEEGIDSCVGSLRDEGPVHRGAFDWHAVAHARPCHKGDSEEAMDKSCDLPDCQIEQDCVWVLLLVESGSVLGEIVVG